MDYRQEVENNSYCYTMSGKFTFSDHGSFRDILNVIKQGDIKGMTFDLAGISFIDSAALGLLLVAREEAEKHNLTITLKNPSDSIATIFKMSKFYTLFNIE